MKNMMKRNFKVTRGIIGCEEKLALLRVVNKVLTAIEAGISPDRAIRYADCDDLGDIMVHSLETPWLMPTGTSASETDGFVVYGNEYDEDGDIMPFEICTITIPALANLTAISA